MDYKDAIEKLKPLYQSWQSTQNRAAKEIEEAFPELKESENEKMWKSIKVLILNMNDGGKVYDTTKEDMLAWIEKQSEQKYTQKDIDDAYLKGIADVKREVEKQDEQTEKIKKEIAEFIFNSKEDIKYRYEWIKCLGYDVKFLEDENQGEQKPAEWSEEDEKMFSDINDCIKNLPLLFSELKINDENKLCHEFIDKATTWLKNLKDRCIPQQRREWSKEDENKFWVAVEALEDAGKFEIADWFKYLKERYTWKPSEGADKDE